MKYFVVFLPMQDEEKSATFRPDHLAYLEQKRNEGLVFATGRFVDGWGGMVIYKVETLEQAQELANNDPYVVQGARKCEVREWDAMITV